LGSYLLAVIHHQQIGNLYQQKSVGKTFAVTVSELCYSRSCGTAIHYSYFRHFQGTLRVCYDDLWDSMVLSVTFLLFARNYGISGVTVSTYAQDL